jgi:NADPH-dependent 2,4-dienoyl-CoA reductase/sulfur reductase-like enzyme
MKRHLIIGNGVTGNSAAEMIRRLDTEAAVTIFSGSGSAFYYTSDLPEHPREKKERRPLLYGAGQGE